MTTSVCKHYVVKIVCNNCSIIKNEFLGLINKRKDKNKLWGPIDLICSNCIGKGWAQYPVSYVHTALERAEPNTQSEDKRVSEDDQ